MTFIDIFANAHGHFATISQTDEMAVLVRYAKEELQLSDADIPSFLVSTDFSTITKENYRPAGDFFAWYYINYMSEIKLTVSYDIRTLGTPHDDFTIVGIQPQRMDTSTGQPRPRSCQSTEAEFQAVYVESVMGRRLYIAHCRSRDAAIGLCTLLKAFAYRWLK